MSETTSAANAMLFVVDSDASERERVRATLAGGGYAAVPLASLENAADLLRRKAVCDLLVLSSEDLSGHDSELDAVLALSDPPPPVIVLGVGPSGRAGLEGLNRGARDFLAKPWTDSALLEAAFNVLNRDPCDADKCDSRMVASSPVSGWIELTSPSELEQLRRLQRFSDALFASALPEKVCEDLKMAVEEVGRNAMEWGNNFDPDKRVHLSYCFFHDRIVIKCEDEGDGFALGNVPDPTADPVKTLQQRQEMGKRPGGYGVYLMQKLVDQVVYNEKGNSVLMIKYLPDNGLSTRIIPK